jgi:hypothetical protein
MSSEFWLPVNIPALPLLQQLNDWVIKQNEKRLPKWKFRFAPDFAMQIHPRITRANDMLFECFALQTENLTVDLFTDPQTLWAWNYCRIGFNLSVGNGVWTFKCRSGKTSKNKTPAALGVTRGLPFEIVRQRTIDALTPAHFSDLNPKMMLSPHCLCCGKGLTDPASMARWIGPECWGSASTNLPRIFKAMAA